MLVVHLGFDFRQQVVREWNRTAAEPRPLGVLGQDRCALLQEIRPRQAVRFREHQHVALRLPRGFGHERHVVVEGQGKHPIVRSEQRLEHTQFGGVMRFGGRDQNLEPIPWIGLAGRPSLNAALGKAAMKLKRNDNRELHWFLDPCGVAHHAAFLDCRSQSS